MIPDERLTQKEHVSFRLDKSCLERLQNEAKNQNITLTQLLYDIIRQYLDWYSVSPKSGVIPMHKKIITALVERLDDKTLSHIANDIAKNEFKNIILIFKNEFTLDAWLESFDSWLKITGFPYKHEYANEHHTIVVHHEMGQKFSEFEKELLGEVFEMFNVKVDFEVCNDTIMLKFKMQSNHQNRI